MKNISLILTLLLLGGGTVSFAEHLVPATSADQKDFDQQVAQDQDDVDKIKGTSEEHAKKDKKEKKDNFGKIVSAEAKKLKDEPKEQRKQMGQWVSEQRRKNTQSSTGPSSNNGNSGAGHSNSAAAPGRSEGDVSQTGPGRSDQHRK